MNDRKMTTINAETRKAVPGEPGVWILILGDLIIFGVFFTTYAYYRSKNVEL